MSAENDPRSHGCGDGSPAFRVPGRRGEHRRLADARLAREQDEVPAPGDGLVDEVPQLGQDVVPAERTSPAGRRRLA
jgi:hypothetical protein